MTAVVVIHVVDGTGPRTTHSTHRNGGQQEQGNHSSRQAYKVKVVAVVVADLGFVVVVKCSLVFHIHLGQKPFLMLCHIFRY